MSHGLEAPLAPQLGRSISWSEKLVPWKPEPVLQPGDAVTGKIGAWLLAISGSECFIDGKSWFMMASVCLPLIYRVPSQLAHKKELNIHAPVSLSRVVSVPNLLAIDRSPVRSGQLAGPVIEQDDLAGM